ncbi:putative bifunctional diguanylate cyclase/phosphodiesterase [Modestobacter sp. URMC 112]
MTTTNGGGSAGRSRNRLGASQRIMVLTATLAAAAATLFVVVVQSLPAASTAATVPWVLWAVAFGVSEAFPVHVQWKKDSHTFSLTDLVLAAGLVLAVPGQLVPALVVGTGTTLLLHRRQRGLKLAFNVAQYAVGGTLATTLFAVLAAPAGDSWDWLAALAAAGISTVVANACVFAAISLSQGRFDLGTLVSMCSTTVPAAVAAAAVGLVVARNVVHDPGALALLALPTILVIVAYRAVTRANEQQDNLRVLHEVTALLHHGDSRAALGDFLTSVRSAFRADLAELVLLDTADSGAPTLNVSREGGGVSLGAELGDPEDAERLMRLAMAGGALRTGAERGGPLDAYASARDVKDAMAAVLRTEDRVHGLMVIGGRHGDVSTFTETDLALLETFSRHVGTSLERGRLEETLRQVTDLKEQLRHQALHDPLTDLPNRTLFIDRVQQAVAAAARTQAWPAVLYVDLDGFKPVNDTYGHEAGDLLLRTVATRLRQSLRAGDTAARLGGDEFAVLLEGPVDDAGVAGVVDRLQERLGVPVDLGGARVTTVGASIGVAVCDATARDADELIRRADVAMYTAKRGGGNAVCLHGPHLETPESVTPAAELEQAVRDGELRVVYQPLIDLASGQLTGAEALVRWQHPVDGVRMPDSFIPLAEETGLIVPLGAQVLLQACAEAARWVAARPDLTGLMVTVNLSARQLMHPEVVGHVRTALQSAGLAPERLVLEITETVLMHDRDAAATALWGLKRLGVRIAIDDFGTGYSSLAYLRRFPIDMLKVAREFVDGLGRDANDDVITRAIVDLADTLGLLTVAEGVESTNQQEHVAALGCDLAQGYLFARPVAAEDLHAMVLDVVGGASGQPVHRAGELATAG